MFPCTVRSWSNDEKFWRIEIRLRIRSKKSRFWAFWLDGFVQKIVFMICAWVNAHWWEEGWCTSAEAVTYMTWTLTPKLTTVRNLFFSRRLSALVWFFSFFFSHCFYIRDFHRFGHTNELRHKNRMTQRVEPLFPAMWSSSSFDRVLSKRFHIDSWASTIWAYFDFGLSDSLQIFLYQYIFSLQDMTDRKYFVNFFWSLRKTFFCRDLSSLSCPFQFRVDDLCTSLEDTQMHQVTRPHWTNA